MKTGRPKSDLRLTNEERSQLQSFVLDRSLPEALCARARIVLSSADGELNSTIAEHLHLTKATVGKWRARFIERRIAGLYDEVRPGKPRTIDDERVAQLIDTMLHTQPADGASQWSVRTAAAKTGISKTSVARYFQRFGPPSYRSDASRLGNDPRIFEKLRAVVGLYLSLADNALVICVDEARQQPVLQGSPPMLPVLPMGLDEVQGVIDGEPSPGTTTLFAAVSVLDGALVAPCKRRDRPHRVLALLRTIDKAVPPGLDIHCFVDHDATHHDPRVAAWLAQRPRWRMHVMPTFNSWLLQVGRFLARTLGKATRRGSPPSGKLLVQRIEHFVAVQGATGWPFQWTATADALVRLQRPHGGVSAV